MSKFVIHCSFCKSVCSFIDRLIDCCVDLAMDRSSGSPSPRWYEGKTSDPQQSPGAVRVGPSAVNVISITRRPEGGIVNVEVRRQEGGNTTGVDQTSGSFGSQTGSFSSSSSRESSPRNAVIFAKTPPLPVGFRGFGGIALHGAGDTGRLHRALADHVRALHGQSLFDRFNEPAPPFIDTHHHLSHSSSSLASGRRVHTIPIRIGIYVSYLMFCCYLRTSRL